MSITVEVETNIKFEGTRCCIYTYTKILMYKLTYMNEYEMVSTIYVILMYMAILLWWAVSILYCRCEFGFSSRSVHGTHFLDDMYL